MIQQEVLKEMISMIFEKLIRIPNDRIAVLIGKSGSIKSKIEQICYVDFRY